MQKAYLRAMSRKLLTQGKWEISTGEYASGLVLVPYHDRIKKVMDRWGDQAATETWKEEHTRLRWLHSIGVHVTTDSST